MNFNIQSIHQTELFTQLLSYSPLYAYLTYANTRFLTYLPPPSIDFLPYVISELIFTVIFRMQKLDTYQSSELYGIPAIVLKQFASELALILSALFPISCSSAEISPKTTCQERSFQISPL